MPAERSRPRIAVCFFGITRSLAHTIGSIRANILAPARAVGTVQVFAHLYPLTRIDNPRSGEAGALDPGEHRLLEADALVLEPPGGCLDRWSFDRLAAFGDFYGDGFRSLRNLVHQLHSLREVGTAALATNPDIVVFARPDLVYFDSFARTLAWVARRRAPVCGLPYWQEWGGRNDRFAVIRGHDLARRYAGRIERALDYCAAGPRPLRGERFLGWCLADAPLRHVALRAARLRADGQFHPVEPFAPEAIRTLQTRVHFSRLPRPVKSAGHKALGLVHQAVDLALYGSARDPVRAWRESLEPR